MRHRPAMESTEYLQRFPSNKGIDEQIIAKLWDLKDSRLCEELYDRPPCGPNFAAHADQLDRLTAERERRMEYGIGDRCGCPLGWCPNG